MTTNMSRRTVMAGAGGLLVAGADGMLPAMAAGAAPGTIDLASPEANLVAFIRMMASMEEVDVPWWFNGTVYAVLGEEQNPQPLFTFEGLEIYLVSHLEDGSYELTGNTVTFFRGFDGEWLKEYENPFTGKTVKVGEAVQGGGPGRGFNLSVNGVKPSKLIDQLPDQPLKKWWSVAGGYVWLNNDTVYPPGLTAPRAQAQTMFVGLDDFNNSELPQLPAVFSSTVTMPWQSWMEMEDHPGHLVWHASGAKLNSVDELPEGYRKRAEAEYPERMKLERR